MEFKNIVTIGVFALAEHKFDKPSSGGTPSGSRSLGDELQKQVLRHRAAQNAIRFVADNLHQL